VKIYVKYLRKQVILEEYDSEEAKVFLNWHGNPLGEGELNKKVKKFFLRYGYDMSVTRLRDIVATHIEKHSNDLTDAGETNLIEFF